MGKTTPASRLIWLDSDHEVRGVPDTLRESIGRNWNRFLGYAARKLRDRDEAADVVRGVVHAAVVATHKKAIAHPDAYLFKGVLREVRRRLRRSSRLMYVGSLSELEGVKEAVDADWAKNLDDYLFIQEFVSA